jgi:UPF0755 protein
MSAEPLDPEKYHRFDLMSKKSKQLIVIGAIIIIFVLTPLLGLIYYKIAINRPAQGGNEVTVKIESGSSITNISSYLYEEDVINSPFLFKFYIVINKLQNNIQAGSYKIPAGTSIAEVAQILQHGTDDITITFIEGLRTEEIAKHASVNLDKIDYSDFLKLAKSSEGYLFPDTYEVSSEITEVELINMLKQNFNKKTEDILTNTALEGTGLTQEEVIIFASIIEREVNTEKDRPIVAGILLKRLDDGMRLEADATTQYAVAAQRYGCPIEDNTPKTNVCPDEETIPNVIWWPNDLTVNELQSESPFNTRQVGGLPPAPISNPGIAAIEAVLNPVETPYYYYITDSSGVTHYAETLEEHNENVISHL